MHNSYVLRKTKLADDPVIQLNATNNGGETLV